MHTSISQKQDLLAIHINFAEDLIGHFRFLTNLFQICKEVLIATFGTTQ